MNRGDWALPTLAAFAAGETPRVRGESSFSPVAPERWRPIPGFAGMYDVSDLGRVRSVATPKQEARLRRQYLTGKGYLRVSLFDPRLRKHRLRRVNRLVLAAFVGEPPAGAIGCHNDNNRANNVLTNLRWDTYAANEADKKLHDTVNRGERNPRAALTADQVREIRLAKQRGGRGRWGRDEMAARFGVTPQSVTRIASGVTWTHITVEPSP